MESSFYLALHSGMCQGAQRCLLSEGFFSGAEGFSVGVQQGLGFQGSAFAGFSGFGKTQVLGVYKELLKRVEASQGFQGSNNV